MVKKTSIKWGTPALKSKVIKKDEDEPVVSPIPGKTPTVKPIPGFEPKPGKQTATDDDVVIRKPKKPGDAEIPPQPPKEPEKDI